jgi:3'-phosphoadenosine 5'-phosphosulfate sulfotransferase (PAPS reductase)/FAD synthetase
MGKIRPGLHRYHGEEMTERDQFIKYFWGLTKLPFLDKLRHALDRCREFYEHEEGRVFVSVGGIDSATLALFLWKHIDKDIPAVSISSIEAKSVQVMHRQLAERGNFIFLKPTKTKVQVIKEFGYPILSKDIADRIELIQNPTEDNATVRNAIITGQTGEQGGYRYSHHMKLSNRWQKLFVEQDAPFRVSGKCCYYMKEKPCDQYSKKEKRSVYMGLMASEGGRRALALQAHGCNYYGKTVTRSCPFAIFSRTDILLLAEMMETPIPTVYGEIKHYPDGSIETTRAKRTGCTMCGFGIHMEKRPHRFDRLREDNHKEWEFWMYEQGWGEVLNYIGIGWEDIPEQQGVFDL